jgi:hypothetical protein
MIMANIKNSVIKPFGFAHFVKSAAIFIENDIGLLTAHPPAFKTAAKSRFLRLRYARSVLGRETTSISEIIDSPICQAVMLEMAAINEAAAAVRNPTPIPIAATELANVAAEAVSAGLSTAFLTSDESF